MTFSEKIQKLRKEANIAREELAFQLYAHGEHVTIRGRKQSLK